MTDCEIELTRDKSQEDNTAVFRWFENDDIIASVVQGYFPDECNLRVSFCWSDKYKDLESFEVRGHKSIMFSWDDERLKAWVVGVIKRHIQYPPIQEVVR